MIPPEEWLEPEERRALADSEAHAYKSLANSSGLDIDDRRNWRALDLLYRTHVDFVWTLPVEVPQRKPFTPPRRQNARAAQEANRLRGLRSVQAVKQAYQELSGLSKRNPSIKAVAWYASRLLGKEKTPLSDRRTLEIISQLRAGGQIS